MKMKIASAGRWVIGLAILTLALSGGLMYATDICHEHTSNGSQDEYFYPGTSENFYLDAKAPTYGHISAYVTSPFHGTVGLINVLHGERDGTVILRENLDPQSRFVSTCTSYGSGTGYAHLYTYSKTYEPADCIPEGNNN